MTLPMTLAEFLDAAKKLDLDLSMSLADALAAVPGAECKAVEQAAKDGILSMLDAPSLSAAMKKLTALKSRAGVLEVLIKDRPVVRPTTGARR